MLSAGEINMADDSAEAAARETMLRMLVPTAKVITAYSTAHHELLGRSITTQLSCPIPS